MPVWLAREEIREFLAKLIIGALFAALSANLLFEFLKTGHFTGLLLLASELLVVVLTITRRRAQRVDRSVAAAVATAVAMVMPPLVRAGDSPALLADAATATLSACGLALVIFAKLALGRSFGLAPANRGVVVNGPYRWMRHPIYTGYVITHVGFIAAYPSFWNVAVLCLADAALVVRALMEERTLSDDAKYQVYCRQVAWHLVPGVF